MNPKEKQATPQVAFIFRKLINERTVCVSRQMSALARVCELKPGI